jgi:hypothetical protein
MKQEKERPYFYDKYVQLLGIGIKPQFIATELNSQGIKRKSNSPFTATTVTYTANGYQKDKHVEQKILDLHAQYFSKTTQQSA